MTQMAKASPSSNIQHGSTCPKVHELALLAKGELSAAKMDTLCKHVQWCPDCTKALGQFPDDETLVGSIRRDHPSLIDPEDSEAVALLMSRLRFLPRHTGPTSEVSGANDSNNEPNTATDPILSETQPRIEIDQLINELLGPAESSGEKGRLGQYRLLKVLGSGGMGIVFEAEDTQLGRTVALKIVQPRLLDNQSIRLRFLKEARAAAALEHDNIVPIYQVGEVRSIPFLVMPLLKGETLDSRLRREGSLPIEDVLRIGQQLAMGLAAAHEQGVVHRDIKPANIWLEERVHDASNPTKHFPRVKILDFGLAHAGEEDLQLTDPGAIAGTPAFMAPEQAMGERADARSDLFSLACVLHYMCSGHLPFNGRNTIATMLSVLENKPMPLRELNSSVPERIESLVLQLLQKDPNRRVETAQQVAEILRNTQDGGTTVHTKVPSTLRGWGIAGTIAIVLLAPLFWFMSGLIFKLNTPNGTIVLELDSGAVEGANVFVDDKLAITVRLKDEREQIEIRATPGKHRLSVSKGGFELFTKEFSLMEGQREKMRVHLQSNIRSGSMAASIELPGLVARPATRAGFRHWQIETKMPRGEVRLLAWDSKRQRIACESTNGYVRLIDANNSELSLLIPAHVGAVSSISWSDAFDQLVTAGDDGTLRIYGSDGKHLRNLGTPMGPVHSVAFSPDGLWIASAGSDDTVQLWRNSGEAGIRLHGHTSHIGSVAWHPSGKKLASASMDGTVHIWNVDDGASVEIKTVADNVVGLAWNPRGDWLATVEPDGVIRLLTAEGIDYDKWKGHTRNVTAIGWSSDDTLVTGDQDGNVRLWRSGTELMKSVELGPGRIDALSWTADGSKLAVASNGQVRFFDRNGNSKGAISHVTAPVRSVSWNKKGEFATTGDDMTVRIWSKVGSLLASSRGHTGRVFVVSWNSLGNKIVSAGWDQMVRVWDLSSDKTQVFEGHDPVAWNSVDDLIALSQDKDIALGTIGESPQILRGHERVILGLTWNSAGSKLASSDGSGAIRIWNRDGSAGPTMQSEPSPIALKWNPTQSILAVGGLSNGNIQLWNSNGQLQSTWTAHSKAIFALAWSPEGDQILSTSEDQTIRLWKIDGTSAGALRGSQSAATSVDWDSTSQRIVTVHTDGTIQIWDGISLEPLSTTQLFNDGNWIRFDTTGVATTSDPSILDTRLVVCAEDDFGHIMLLKPSTMMDGRE